MAKRSILPMKADPIRLRLLKRADLPMTLRWRNQDRIRKWFIHSTILTQEQHAAWFNRYLRRDDDFVFIIEETRLLKKPIGQISLYQIDWSRKRSELGRFMIGEEDARGKGFANRAVELLIGFAFRQWKLVEIHIDVFRENVAALALYQKCGFEFEAERDLLWSMKLRNPNFRKEVPR